jgi:hypothetical protein
MSKKKHYTTFTPDGLPDIPGDMSEPAYASLLYDHSCHVRTVIYSAHFLLSESLQTNIPFTDIIRIVKRRISNSLPGHYVVEYVTSALMMKESTSFPFAFCSSHHSWDLQVSALASCVPMAATPRPMSLLFRRSVRALGGYVPFSESNHVARVQELYTNLHLL